MVVSDERVGTALEPTLARSSWYGQVSMAFRVLAVESASSSGTQAGPLQTGDGGTDMSSGPCARTNPSKATAAEQSLCFWMKPTAPTTRDAGYDTGAWWPRSRDLSAELPALFEALAARPGVLPGMADRLIGWESAVRHGTPLGVGPA